MELKKLDENDVKDVLYDYYKKQNCYIEQEFPSVRTDEEENRLVVMYNVSHLVNLNGDKFVDAIVEYWLMPPGGNGHCFQPHKAMIVSAENSYELINPDFIDSFFTMEKVKFDINETMITGTYSDCSDQASRKMTIVIRGSQD